MAHWKSSLHGGNVYWDIGPSAYISYNPAPLMGGDEGAETALVIRKDGAKKFFILNGDWRKEYEEAVEKDGIGGALALFNAHPECLNGWSDGETRGVLKWLGLDELGLEEDE